MTLDLNVDFISPWLLLQFFDYLPGTEERLVKVGIMDVLDITQRFKVTLTVNGVSYKVKAYALALPGMKESLQFEMFPVE